MDIDFAIVLAVIGLSTLVLHFKSHVKFVAMGAFIGLVLIGLVPLDQYFSDENAISAAAVFLLTVPALLLGVNHTVDKRRGKLPWTAVFVLVFTLFFVSSVVQFLPLQLQGEIMNRSIIGWQIIDNHTWFTLAAAVFIMIDSVMHRHDVEKAKKKKKKSKD